MWSSSENSLLAPHSYCGMGSNIELDTNTELHRILPIPNMEKRGIFYFFVIAVLFP